MKLIFRRTFKRNLLHDFPINIFCSQGLAKKLFFSIFQFLKRVFSEFLLLELIFLNFPWKKSISLIFCERSSLWWISLEWKYFLGFSITKLISMDFQITFFFHGVSMADNLFSWVPQYFKLTSLFFFQWIFHRVFLDKIDSHRFLFDKNEFAVFPSQWLQFLRFFVLERVCLDFPWTNLFLKDVLLNKIELYGLPINSQRFFKDAHTTSKQTSSTKTFLRRTNQQNVSMNVSPKKIEQWDF